MGQIKRIPENIGEYIELSDLGVWLCRLKIAGDDIPGYALKINDFECVIGISTKCPHMGCRLFAAEEIPEETVEKALVRCPCHNSCFDILAQGITVIGPATDWLSVMKLMPVAGEPEKVELTGWLNNGDVGRGIPYGKISLDTDEEAL